MNNDNMLYFKDMNLLALITKYVCSILSLPVPVIFLTYIAYLRKFDTYIKFNTLRQEVEKEIHALEQKFHDIYA
jgi:hypothetical protein